MIQTDTPETDGRAQPPVADRYDAVVIGGGPAGSSAAAVIAEAGKSVLLLERRPAGRFHVGESLIPETYWSLKRLGLVERMNETAFVKKYSVQFVSEAGKESSPFYFDLDDDGRPNGEEGTQTWQVERGVVRRDAVGAGRGTGRDRPHGRPRVGRAVGRRAAGRRRERERRRPRRRGEGEVRPGRRGVHPRSEVRRVMLDATGQTAFLGRRLGTMAADPHLKKGTLWSYWENAERRPGAPREDGCTVIIQGANKKTWFWYIPLGDGITSVGCTGDMGHMFGPHRGDQRGDVRVRRSPPPPASPGV